MGVVSEKIIKKTVLIKESGSIFQTSCITSFLSSDSAQYLEEFRNRDYLIPDPSGKILKYNPSDK